MLIVHLGLELRVGFLFVFLEFFSRGYENFEENSFSQAIKKLDVGIKAFLNDELGLFEGLRVDGAEGYDLLVSA